MKLYWGHDKSEFEAVLPSGQSVTVVGEKITVTIGSRVFEFTAPDEQDFAYVSDDGAQIAKISA